MPLCGNWSCYYRAVISWQHLLWWVGRRLLGSLFAQHIILTVDRLGRSIHAEIGVKVSIV